MEKIKLDWISVKDQKPDDGQKVYVIHEYFYPDEPLYTVYDAVNEVFKYSTYQIARQYKDLPIVATHWFPTFPEFKKCHQ